MTAQPPSAATQSPNSTTQKKNTTLDQKKTPSVIQQVEFLPPPATKPVVKTLDLTDDATKSGFQKPVPVTTPPAVETKTDASENDEDI